MVQVGDGGSCGGGERQSSYRCILKALLND